MNRNLFKYITIIFCLIISMGKAGAQFKDDVFSQNYSDSTAVSDTSDQLFSFKELFDGLSHKRR